MGLGPWALALALAQGPEAAWVPGPESWGLLSLRSRAPIYDNRLSYPSGRAAVLPRGAAQGVLALSHVNTWAQMRGYFFDGEFSRLEMRLAYGVTPRTEVALHLAGLRRSGGGMDGFIEGFHRLVHVTQSRRDAHPRNALHVSTERDGATRDHLTHSDTGVGWLAPVAVVRRQLLPSQRTAWVAELHLQLPLGDVRRQYAAPGPSLLMAITLGQPLAGWLQLTAASGLMVSPRPGQLYGMPLTAVPKFFLLGLTAALGRRVAVAAHYLNQDGIVTDAHFLPMHLSTNEFVLGVLWRPPWTPRALFELGLIENSIHDANTPDFGVSLAMRLSTR